MEDEELSPALLQPQVAAVAALDALRALTGGQDVLLLRERPSLRQAVQELTQSCHEPLHKAADPFWLSGANFRFAESLPALGRAPAAPEIREWHKRVSGLEECWAQRSREATKLRDACRDVATGRGMAGAVEEILKKGIKEAMGEAIREALEGVLEVGEEVGGTVVAESQARAVSVMRRRAEEALGLLNRLVMACRRTRAFYRGLRHRVGDVTDTVKRGEGPPHEFHAALAAKVGTFQRLCVAGHLLARDYLLGALGDICTIFRCGDPDGSIARAVTERCQRASKDIPNLLQGR